MIKISQLQIDFCKIEHVFKILSWVNKALIKDSGLNLP